MNPQEGCFPDPQVPHPRAAGQRPGRVFHWQEILDSGRYASITELAEALQVDRSYVRRILTLTTLAPDIVEIILRGAEPSGLSLERLTKGMPMAWEEQRERLRFTAR